MIATRGLIAEGSHGLDAGGVLWFMDLTVRDETLVKSAFEALSDVGRSSKGVAHGGHTQASWYAPLGGFDAKAPQESDFDYGWEERWIRDVATCSIRARSATLRAGNASGGSCSSASVARATGCALSERDAGG